jgi:hypothetical protein
VRVGAIKLVVLERLVDVGTLAARASCTDIVDGTVVGAALRRHDLVVAPIPAICRPSRRPLVSVFRSTITEQPNLALVRLTRTGFTKVVADPCCRRRRSWLGELLAGSLGRAAGREPTQWRGRAIRRRFWPSDANPPDGGPEASEQLAEAAEHGRVYAQLRQQLDMVAVVGVDLVGQLVARLLRLVMVALALQELDDLVLADIHDLPLKTRCHMMAVGADTAQQVGAGAPALPQDEQANKPPDATSNA